MSEEKKKITDEERIELKEGLKKKIDEMSDEELDKVAGGIRNSNEETSNKEKWAKVGIKIVEVNGLAEYYLIKDGTRISLKKAIEIYTANGGEL